MQSFDFFVVGLNTLLNKHWIWDTVTLIWRHYNELFLAPSSLPHETTEDVELGGYVLPKGTMVVPELRSVNTDSEAWPEPEVFRPERWIDDTGNIRKSDCFIPFSTGT